MHASLRQNGRQGDCAVQGFDLIFYGDSITEDWRGTSGGVPWPIGTGSDKVFQKHFAAKYRAEVLAIAGAQHSPSRASLGFIGESCERHDILRRLIVAIHCL